MWLHHTLAIRTMTVLALPPRESCSSRVSLESRYGMCVERPSTSADITLPNHMIISANDERREIILLYIEVITTCRRSMGYMYTYKYTTQTYPVCSGTDWSGLPPPSVVLPLRSCFASHSPASRNWPIWRDVLLIHWSITYYACLCWVDRLKK